MPSLLAYLRTLAARVRARGPGFPPFGLPPFDGDPDEPVREPRRPPPGGRTAAIALDEPKDIEPLEARGVRRVG